MHKLLIFIIFISLTGCASNGVNQGAEVADNHQAQAEEQVADAGDDDKYEVICRRERSTGSRLAQRVCKTRYQIEKEREESQERLRREQGVNARRIISSHSASEGG